MHCVDFPILILLALLRWGVGRSFVRLGASRWLKAFSKGLGIPVDILAYFPLQTGASGGNTFSEHIFGAPSLDKIGLACAAAAWVHWEGLDGGRWARNTRRSCAPGAAEAWAWNMRRLERGSRVCFSHGGTHSQQWNAAGTQPERTPERS